MKKNRSVALGWMEEMIAPVVYARGTGLTAERIMEIAREEGIPVIKDELLADILSDTDIGMYIPQETWEAVAAVFSFLDRFAGRRSQTV